MTDASISRSLRRVESALKTLAVTRPLFPPAAAGGKDGRRTSVPNEATAPTSASTFPVGGVVEDVAVVDVVTEAVVAPDAAVDDDKGGAAAAAAAAETAAGDALVALAERPSNAPASVGSGTGDEEAIVTQLGDIEEFPAPKMVVRDDALVPLDDDDDDPSPESSSAKH